MKQIYFVDSENVSEIWIDLLNYCQEQDEVIVFYTSNSPHIGYENVQRLLNTKKQAEFIKCYEGSNGLDFQLVTELGYRIGSCTETDIEFIVVTNDNGFEAAVKYWKDREKPVKRYNAKFCKTMFQKAESEKKKERKEQEEAAKKERKEREEAVKKERKEREEAAKTERKEQEETVKTERKEQPEQNNGNKAPEPELKKQPNPEEPGTKEQKPSRKSNFGRRRGKRKTEVMEIRQEESLPNVVVTVETVQKEMVQQDAEQLEKSEEAVKSVLRGDPKTEQPENIVSPVIMQEEKSAGVEVVPPEFNSARAASQAEIETEAENSGQPAVAENVTAETAPEEVKPEAEPEEVKLETEPEEVKPEMEPEEVKPEAKPEEVKPEAPLEETVSQEKAPDTETAGRTQVLQEEQPEKNEGELSSDILEIASCLGDNRESLHNALVIFFGDEEGKDIYQKIKEQVDFKNLKRAGVKERFAAYCRIVFRKADPGAECPEELPAYIYEAADKRKNLNSFRAALQNKFGKEQGLKYYTILKSHMKILNRI